MLVKGAPGHRNWAALARQLHTPQSRCYRGICTWSTSWLLTHWGRVMDICVSKRTLIGSYNGLSPSRRQAIIWTNAGILLIGPSGTIFSENLIEIHTFSFKKMHLKMSSGKWRPSCLGLNEINNPLPHWSFIRILLLPWRTSYPITIVCKTICIR